MATVKELLQSLREKGIEQVYGRSLSRCTKRELERFSQSLQLGYGGEHISYSQVNMLLRCGFQFFYRYVQGLKIPPGSALTFGKAYHTAIIGDRQRGIRGYYAEKLDSGHETASDVVQDIFHQEFSRLRGDTLWEDHEDPAYLEKIGTELCSEYVEGKAKRVVPVSVEESCTIEFENYRQKFVAFPDVLTKTGIIEEKTAAKDWSEQRVRKDLQGTVYWWAYDILRGQAPKSLSFHIGLKTKIPKVKTHKTERDSDDVNHFRRTLAHAIQVIQTRTFLPALPDSWMCSPKYCGYYALCHKDMP